ncbi:hypothetical protein CHI14_21555 [Paenibacillus sp. 7516]|nr:hypothetical protein CHI14_21555 [Paenibacillus sp. 7516]
MRSYFILMMCIVLFGCSNDASRDAQPDHIQLEDGGSLTATKQVGEYLLRLVVQPAGENTYMFHSGIKYVGTDTSHTIAHSKHVFMVDIQANGESILPPRTTTNIGLTTELTNEDWYTEPYEITLTQAQLEKMDGSEANIVLHAYFQGGQSGYEDEKKMILSASQALLQEEE